MKLFWSVRAKVLRVQNNSQNRDPGWGWLEQKQGKKIKIYGERK